MSSAATVTTRIFDGYEAGSYTVPSQDSPSASTLKVTKWRQLFELAAGTYKIPDLAPGQSVLLDIGGNVTITNAAGTSIGDFFDGNFVEVFALPTAGEFGYRTYTADVPVGKFSTSSTTTSVTPTAAVFSGAQHVFWENTADGTLALETPSAAAMIAAHQGGSVQGTGSYLLTIVNRGNNTITITGGDDVTIAGENTIATLVTRTYLVTYAATELTMRSVSKGTIET